MTAFGAGPIVLGRPIYLRGGMSSAINAQSVRSLAKVPATALTIGRANSDTFVPQIVCDTTNKQNTEITQLVRSSELCSW